MSEGTSASADGSSGTGNGGTAGMLTSSGSTAGGGASIGGAANGGANTGGTIGPLGGAGGVPSGTCSDGIQNQAETAIDCGGPCAPCCAPQPSTPLAWWRGEDSGAEEISGRDLTLNNGFVVGAVGRAFSFNGTDQIMELSNGESLLPLGSVSTELWIQTTQAANAAVFALYDCAFSCTANGKSAWTVRLNAAGQVSINVRDADGGGPGANGYQILNSQGAVNDGAFHHVVGVRDLANLMLVLYVDGKRDAEAPLDPNTTGQLVDGDAEQDPFTVGARHTSGAGGPLTEFFAGSVDELTIYTSALTDAEVKSLYDAGATGKCTTP